MHFGCADPAALNAAAKYIEAQKPNVVVCTGDISRDGRSIEQTEACAWLRALPAPVVITPGNHDVPYYNLWGRIFDPFGRFRKAAHGLDTGVWAWTGALDFENLGYAVVGLFLLTWAASVVIWKARRIDERWGGALRRE